MWCAGIGNFRLKLRHENAKLNPDEIVLPQEVVDPDEIVAVIRRELEETETRAGRLEESEKRNEIEDQEEAPKVDSAVRRWRGNLRTQQDWMKKATL